MANLIEDIVSLEDEADSIVAQAHAEAKELEKSAILEIEAYRQKLAEETDRKVAAFSKEMEEKQMRSAGEMEKDLRRALDAVDQIAGGALNRQIEKIVTKLSEL
jgi:hypothetical protein